MVMVSDRSYTYFDFVRWLRRSWEAKFEYDTEELNQLCVLHEEEYLALQVDFFNDCLQYELDKLFRIIQVLLVLVNDMLRIAV